MINVEREGEGLKGWTGGREGGRYDFVKKKENLKKKKKLA